MATTFFNLLVNASFSLAAGLLVVGFFLWLFRVPAGPWKLGLLSLPFLKLVYDTVRGLPANSILLQTFDPLALPPKHQLLTVGFGVNSWGPVVNVKFASENVDGTRFAASMGDYLTLLLQKHAGPSWPLILVSAILAVSATLLSVRIAAAVRFEGRRRADRARAFPLGSAKLFSRRVDLYVSDSFSGTPFTGGLLRPYVCIPRDARDRLQPEELDAVIAHELAHVRQFDLIGSVAVQILGDLFWFVPGYRWLSRRIDRLREIVADQRAVRAGASPARLASALLKLKEIPETADRFVLYSAFVREKSLLKTRVEGLLETRRERAPRFGWNRLWLRTAVTVWIFTAVMSSTFGGNHPSRPWKNAAWFEALLRRHGLEFLTFEP